MWVCFFAPEFQKQSHSAKRKKNLGKDEFSDSIVLPLSRCPAAYPRQEREHARDEEKIDRTSNQRIHAVDTVTSFTRLGHMT
jgi:hypothetical protein